MTGRGTRSFRYGARLKITGPLAAVFLATSAEMVWLAASATGVWRIAFGILASLTTLLAISMIRETMVRIRGRRRVVVAAKELVVPSEGSSDITIPFRDIRSLELVGAPGFGRSLRIRHANGEVAIAGVMLGSVRELDEIHGLVKAARKPRA